MTLHQGDWLLLAQKIEELDDRIRALADIDVDRLQKTVHELEQQLKSQEAEIKKLSQVRS